MAVDESLRNRAIRMLEKEQDELDGCFDKQSDVIAPDNYTKSEFEQLENGEWTEKKVPIGNKIYDESVVDQKEKDLRKKQKCYKNFVRK